MDWGRGGTLDNKGHKYNIGAVATGLGTSRSITPAGAADFGRSTAMLTYQDVEIKITVDGISFGELGDINPNLTLDNFLEII